MPRPYKFFGVGTQIPLGTMKNLPLTGMGVGSMCYIFFRFICP